MCFLKCFRSDVLDSVSKSHSLQLWSLDGETVWMAFRCLLNSYFVTDDKLHVPTWQLNCGSSLEHLNLWFFPTLFTARLFFMNSFVALKFWFIFTKFSEAALWPPAAPPPWSCATPSCPWTPAAPPASCAAPSLPSPPPPHPPDRAARQVEVEHQHQQLRPVCVHPALCRFIVTIFNLLWLVKFYDYFHLRSNL